MKFEIRNHILYEDGKPVKFKQSPHHGGTFKPKYFIIHYDAAINASSTPSWFMDKQSKVSSQLFMDRDGNITQFLKMNVVGWHTGISSYNDDVNLNDEAFGIELQNAGLLIKKGDTYTTLNGKTTVGDVTVINGLAWQTFTPIQIEKLALLNQCLTNHYNLQATLGHEEIAPKRKIDPGKAFPWKFIKTVEVMKTKKLSTNANLRIDASTDFAPVQVLPKDTVVILVGPEKDGFSYVKLNDVVKGWVSSKYLV